MRGLRNPKGTSCHLGSALQLICHCVPEVSAALRNRHGQHSEKEEKKWGVGGAATGDGDDDDDGGGRDPSPEGPSPRPRNEADSAAATTEAPPASLESSGVLTSEAFLDELSELFGELLENPPAAAAGVVDSDSGAPAAASEVETAVDPSRLYSYLPAPLNGEISGDAATALRGILAAVMAEGKERTKASGDAVLGGALVDALEGTTVTTIEGVISEIVSRSSHSEGEDGGVETTHAEEQPVVVRRTTRTKRGRERTWRCPLPVPVIGCETLEDAVRAVTVDVQYVEGYDWKNSTGYEETNTEKEVATCVSSSVISDGDDSDCDSDTSNCSGGDGRCQRLDREAKKGPSAVSAAVFVVLFFRRRGTLLLGE